MLDTERFDRRLGVPLEAVAADDVGEDFLRIDGPDEPCPHTQAETLLDLNVGILLVAAEAEGVGAVFTVVVNQPVVGEQRPVAHTGKRGAQQRMIAANLRLHRKTREPEERASGRNQKSPSLRANRDGSVKRDRARRQVGGGSLRIREDQFTRLSLGEAEFNKNLGTSFRRGTRVLEWQGNAIHRQCQRRSGFDTGKPKADILRGPAREKRAGEVHGDVVHSDVVHSDVVHSDVVHVLNSLGSQTKRAGEPGFGKATRWEASVEKGRPENISTPVRGLSSMTSGASP